MSVRPKKSLGQHFLKDDNIARKIDEAISDLQQKTVLEIGPGTGVLTSHLIAQRDLDLYAIEVDQEAYEYLSATFPTLGDKLIFKNFFLSTIEGVYQKGKYKTIAAFSEKK